MINSYLTHIKFLTFIAQNSILFTIFVHQTKRDMTYQEKIEQRLAEIENQCANEFYHLPDFDGDFDEVWECYCESCIESYSSKEEDIKDYLERINNFDFIDWLIG